MKVVEGDINVWEILFKYLKNISKKKGGQKPNEEVEKNLKIVKIVNKLYEKTRIHRAEVEQKMVLERVNKQ